jgi:hypothetical protein
MGCKKQNQQSEERVEVVQNIALTKDVYEDLKLYGEMYNDSFSKIIRDLMDVNDGKHKPLLKREPIHFHYQV